MVREVRAFTVTIPVGGTPLAPQVFNLDMPARIVTGIEIVVPDGNRGALNFALGAGGTQLIPANASAFITTNDEIIKWPIEGGIESGAWQLFAYNTGVLQHNLHIRFLLELVQTYQPLAPLAGSIITNEGIITFMTDITGSVTKLPGGTGQYHPTITVVYGGDAAP